MRDFQVEDGNMQGLSQIQVQPEQHEIRYGIIDLFAGIGGVARGFKQQGRFDVVALVDNDQHCHDTYIENYPDANYILNDIRNVTLASLLKAADGREIHGIVGCPPCQGFSPAGTRNADHPMNELARDYFRLVREVNPQFVVMENVPDILTKPMFQELAGELEETGYQLWRGILNAALYGVPQTRQRAIMIGFRNDLELTPAPPPATHFGLESVYDYAAQKLVNLTDENGIGALGVYPSTARIKRKGNIGSVPWMDFTEEDYVWLLGLPPIVQLADALSGLPEPSAPGEKQELNGHFSWGHTPALLDRLRGVPAGGNLNGGRQGQPYFSQAYARLHRQGLALTLSTYFHNPGSGRYLHYDDLRCLSVREAARIQTISDKDNEVDGFLFPANGKVSERMVGNAFPSKMATAIADQIYRQLNTNAQ